MSQLPKNSGDPFTQDPAIFMQYFRSGDLRALKLVFYQFYAALSYFANRLTEDPAAADQIVEDSFAALWDERSSFEEVAAIKTFLYLHIQHGCFQFIKTWQTAISQDADWDQIRAISEKYVPNELIRTEVFKGINEAPDILTQLSKKITATRHIIRKNIRDRVLKPVQARLTGLRPI